MSDLLNPATKTIDEWPATAGCEKDLSNDYLYEWCARAGYGKNIYLHITYLITYCLTLHIEFLNIIFNYQIILMNKINVLH